MKNGKPIQMQAVRDAQTYRTRAEFLKAQGRTDEAGVARSVAGGLEKLAEMLKGEVTNGL